MVVIVRIVVFTIKLSAVDYTIFESCYRYCRSCTSSYEDWETVQTFSYGSCGYLAYELHKQSGNPFAVFTDPNFDSWSGHVAIRIDTTHFLDIDGIQTVDSLRQRFPKIAGFKLETMDIEKFSELMKVNMHEPYKNLDDLEIAVLSKLSQDLLNDFA